MTNRLDGCWRRRVWRLVGNERRDRTRGGGIALGKPRLQSSERTTTKRHNHIKIVHSDRESFNRPTKIERPRAVKTHAPGIVTPRTPVAHSVYNSVASRSQPLSLSRLPAALSSALQPRLVLSARDRSHLRTTSPVELIPSTIATTRRWKLENASLPYLSSRHCGLSGCSHQLYQEDCNSGSIRRQTTLGCGVVGLRRRTASWHRLRGSRYCGPSGGGLHQERKQRQTTLDQHIVDGISTEELYTARDY
jgi:hypothetical protein